MDKRGLYMPPKVNACFTSKLKKKKEKKIYNYMLLSS